MMTNGTWAIFRNTCDMDMFSIRQEGFGNARSEKRVPAI